MNCKIHVKMSIDFMLVIPKTSSKKTNPYANAHTAGEIRKVSDTQMQGVKKSISKIV